MMQAERQAENGKSGLAAVATARGVLVVIAASVVGLMIVAFGLDNSTETTTSNGAGLQPAQSESALEDQAAAGTTVGSVGSLSQSAAPVDASTVTTAQDAGVSETTTGASDDTDSGDASAGSDTVSSTTRELLVSEVVVQVLNGGGPKGVAGNATTKLKDDGYDTLAAKNAYAEFHGPSQILHLAGYEAEAIGVAAEFGADVSLLGVFTFDDPPAEDLDPSAVVVVIIGEDGVLAP